MKIKNKLGQESIMQIMMDALNDSKFKSELKKNPKEVIENKFGVTTDQDFKVLENTDTVSYIVVPYFTDEEIQLKEKEINRQSKSHDPINALNYLIFNCAKDDALKQKLIENPKQYIEQECHMTFPENMTLKVAEDSKTLTHIVIPNKNAELSEEELKQLSGGIIFVVAALAGLIYLKASQLNKHPEWREMRPL